MYIGIREIVSKLSNDKSNFSMMDLCLVDRGYLPYSNTPLVIKCFENTIYNKRRDDQFKKFDSHYMSFLFTDSCSMLIYQQSNTIRKDESVSMVLIMLSFLSKKNRVKMFMCQDHHFVHMKSYMTERTFTYSLLTKLG